MNFSELSPEQLPCTRLRKIRGRTGDGAHPVHREKRVWPSSPWAPNRIIGGARDDVAPATAKRILSHTQSPKSSRTLRVPELWIRQLFQRGRKNVRDRCLNTRNGSHDISNLGGWNQYSCCVVHKGFRIWRGAAALWWVSYIYHTFVNNVLMEGRIRATYTK